MFAKKPKTMNDRFPAPSRCPSLLCGNERVMILSAKGVLSLYFPFEFGSW